MICKCNSCGYQSNTEQPYKFCMRCGSNNITIMDEPVTESSLTSEQEYKSEPTEFQNGEAVTDLSWNGWGSKPIGHETAMLAMFELEKHADSFSKQLSSARQEWLSKKESSQKIYDSLIESANSDYEKEYESHISQFNNGIAQVNGTRTKMNNINASCKNFQNYISGYKMTAAINQAAASVGSADYERSNLEKALANKERALTNLREAKIAESQATKNQKHDKARKEQIDRDNHNERDYNAQKNQIIRSGNSDVSMGFNKNSVRAYSRKVSSLRFNGSQYECPKDIPDCVMLGDICFDIIANQQDDLSVVQAVKAQTSDFGQDIGLDYSVKIPYCQRLEDGISLEICYSGVDRTYAQALIQPLLLKLFLSFPAGKLEATMIDPLELGASFPDIPKIADGPNSARIIDTKIWSKERDIENAIATLRQRLEDLTQAYGRDMASRLKNEPVKALAITDFPLGFTETSLKDLHAIVRNSASLGVCVLICVNNEELEKLKKRHGNLVAEIEQSLVEVHVKNRKLYFKEDESNRLYFVPDPMQDVLDNKNSILSILRDSIDRHKDPVVSINDIFPFDIYDSNNWFTGSRSEISIPIGGKGANTIVKMTLGRGGGSVEHHALVAGKTGAGKSTFLHALILSTMITYSPNDVQMYLVDFKEGVEFSLYSKYKLPSLRVVAINSEREFGLNILKELCTELESRTKQFTRYGVSDILSYSEIPGVPKIPKLLLIFDEVQELFRSGDSNDNISSESLSYIGKLVMQGRAMGIHLIFAAQDFSNCPGLEKYFSQMPIRIAIKSTEEGSASILGANNSGVHSLQQKPAGTAIYNNGGGADSANNLFKVAYANEEERKQIVETLDEYYYDPAIEPLYEDKETRVLLTNAQDDVKNEINRLIFGGRDTVEHIGKEKNGYGLLLGQGFGRKSRFVTELQPKQGDNLLVVTKEEKTALSIFELATMSILYEELHTDCDKANALVYIIDLFADELADGDCDFDYLEDCFEKQIKVAKIGEASNLIESVYNTVMARSDGSVPSDERIFLLFFGLDRARRLRQVKVYDNDATDELTPMEMLQKILQYGPKYGVNSIVWSEGVRGVSLMLGDRYESLFDKRIAFRLNDDDMDLLVAETSNKLLGSQTAVYMDVSCDIKNTHFRPYEIPTKAWMDDYSEVYEEVINEEGEN